MTHNLRNVAAEPGVSQIRGSPVAPLSRTGLAIVHLAVNGFLVLGTEKWIDPIFRRLGRRATLESGEAMLLVVATAIVGTIIFWAVPGERRIVPGLVVTAACVVAAIADAWFLGSYRV